MSLTQTQVAALRLAVAAAVASERATKLPSELTLPQWVDESGCGAHEPGNNCFGIKAVAGTAAETLPTEEYVHSSQTPITEGQQFQVFPTLQACFDRHASLITTGKPYAAAWAQYQKDGDIRMLVQRVAHSYATDPLYGTKILRILQMAEVRAALTAARNPIIQIAKAT